MRAVVRPPPLPPPLPAVVAAPRRGNRKGWRRPSGEGSFGTRLHPPGHPRAGKVALYTWQGHIAGVRVSITASRKADLMARIAERRRLASQHQRGDHAARSMTVADWAHQWLAGLTIDHATLTQYARKVQIHIVPRLGPMRLVDLRPSTINAFLSGLIRPAGPYAAPTVAHTQTVLHLVLQAAQADGLPIDPKLLLRGAVPSVHQPRTVRPVLTAEQASMFLAAIRAEDDPLWPFVWLALDTGLRRGELLGLRWEDVDLTSGIVAVRRQVVRGPVGQPPQIKALKGNKTGRAVVLTSTCRAAFAALHDQRHPAPSQFIVWDGVTNRTQWLWMTLRARYGLDAVRIHDLRHTHATLLHAAGVDLRSVSDQLGHSSVGVTSAVYVQTGLAAARLRAETLELFLSGRNTHPPPPDDAS